MRKISISKKRDDGDEGFDFSFNLPKNMENSVRLALLEKGRIYLSGPVDYNMSRIVSDSLMFLTAEPPISGEVRVQISSLGGSSMMGMEIHDQLLMFTLETGIPIVGIAIGPTASAAAMFILQGCSHRVATENCSLLCHDGTMLLEPFTPKEFAKKDWYDKIARAIRRDEERAYRILTRRTGKTLREVKKLLEDEEFLSAQEAKEFGLIDHVIEFKIAKASETKKLAKKQKTKLEEPIVS